MANYLSRPYQPSAPVSRGNINLDMTVLNTLQSRYDANKAIVDQAMSQYEMLKGLRPEDNSYIAAKVAEAKAQIDKFGNMRFEHKSSVDTVMSTLKNVLEDPIVKDAIQSRAVMDNLNAEVSKLKEKNPEKYNDANYQYALYQGGYYDYMQGKSNKLGSMSYTPYTDLTEEHLKKVKTITDIKGKRVIEEPVNEYGIPDPNGKYIRTKEIDGLTPQEINNYIGSMLTSQELQQLKINGWAKYLQTDDSKAKTRVLYSDYHAQNIKNNESELATAIKDRDNSNLGENINKQSGRKVEELEYKIKSLKSLDLSKISDMDMASELEKLGYVNSLSQIAGTEWSVKLGKNDVYYEDRNLDIKYQELDLKKKEYELNKLKVAKEFGVDENGNPLSDESVSKSARTTNLEDLTEKGAGLKSLETEQRTAYKNIIDVTKEFVKNISEDERESFLGYLKERGVVQNKDTGWFEFEDENKHKSNSVVATITDVFNSKGFASSYADYGKRISANYALKVEKAKDILKVKNEGLSKNLSSNPDAYISDLTDSMFYVYEHKEGRDKVGQDIKKLIPNTKSVNGGDINFGILKNELKEEIKKNPKIANLFSKIQEEYYDYQDYNIFLTANKISQKSLLKDSTQDIEEIIQRETKSGKMTSLYNDFTFKNEKVKEKVLNMIPNERTFIKGSDSPVLLNRAKDSNVSFYKNGNNIVIVQEDKVAGKPGQPPSTIVSETILTERDAAYQEISNLINLEGGKKTIPVTSDSVFTPVKISMQSFENNQDGRERKQNAVLSILAEENELIAPFSWVSSYISPVKFAQALTTTDVAKPLTQELLLKKGIPQDKVNNFTEKLYQNINTYQFLPKSAPNLSATGYNLTIDVKKGQDRILKTNLGINEVTEGLNYMMSYHPQVLFINDLLRQVNVNNIDSYINRL